MADNSKVSPLRYKTMGVVVFQAFTAPSSAKSGARVGGRFSRASMAAPRGSDVGASSTARARLTAATTSGTAVRSHLAPTKKCPGQRTSTAMSRVALAATSCTTESRNLGSTEMGTAHAVSHRPSFAN